MNKSEDLDFNKGDGLVPAIIQDAGNGAVLMLGYMNREAFDKTKTTGKVHFFSRSKNRLWMKGESSGNVLDLVSISIDCDRDTVLVQARPQGPTCHTGNQSCFADAPISEHSFLSTLESIIRERRAEASQGSYVSGLFKEGTKKIAQKVIEEAGEAALEALDRKRELFLEEGADLLFHFLVLLADQDLNVTQVLEVLSKRHSK